MSLNVHCPSYSHLGAWGEGLLEIRSKISHRLARRWPIIASNYKGVLGSDDDDDVDDVDDGGGGADDDEDDDDDGEEPTATNQAANPPITINQPTNQPN